MSVIKFSKFAYAEPRKGEDLELCLFEHEGSHPRSIWFASCPTEYLQVEVEAAQNLVTKHIACNLEVRITNIGDELVFHAKDRRVIYGAIFLEIKTRIPTWKRIPVLRSQKAGIFGRESEHGRRFNFRFMQCLLQLTTIPCEIARGQSVPCSAIVNVCT